MSKNDNSSNADGNGKFWHCHSNNFFSGRGHFFQELLRSAIVFVKLCPDARDLWNCCPVVGC